MCHKEFLQNTEKTMIAAAYVDKAKKMAATLEDREISLAGSRVLSREKVARITGVSVSLLHSLRYRPPKSIAADVFDKLCSAVERQAERQIERLQNELISARSRSVRVDDNILDEAEAVLAKARSLLSR